MAHLGQVHEEVLQPQTGPLADGGELGRLKVGVGEAGEGAVTAGEAGELAGGCRQPPCEELQGLPDEQDVGVVGDEGAGGAEVEDASGPLVHAVRLLGVVP